MLIFGLSFLAVIPVVMIILSVGGNHKESKEEKPFKVFRNKEVDEDDE